MSWEIAFVNDGDRDRVEITISVGLVPVEVDDEGLMSALADLAHETQEKFDIDCRFECDPPVNIPDNFIATRLFRIAREAVHNAVRHAQAGTLIIRLSNREKLAIEVQDNGIGFFGASEDSGGRGLQMMRHRCGLIGGHLSIHECETGGTLITCSIDRQLSCDL